MKQVVSETEAFLTCIERIRSWISSYQPLWHLPLSPLRCPSRLCQINYLVYFRLPLRLSIYCARAPFVVCFHDLDPFVSSALHFSDIGCMSTAAEQQPHSASHCHYSGETDTFDDRFLPLLVGYCRKQHHANIISIPEFTLQKQMTFREQMFPVPHQQTRNWQPVIHRETCWTTNWGWAITSTDFLDRWSTPVTAFIE